MSARTSTSTSKYWKRNFSAMLFFDKSEEWSLLNFLKYLDSMESLDNRSEAYHKYKLFLNNISNNKEMSKKKEQRLSKHC